LLLLLLRRLLPLLRRLRLQLSLQLRLLLQLQRSLMMMMMMLLLLSQRRLQDTAAGARLQPASGAGRLGGRRRILRLPLASLVAGDAAREASPVLLVLLVLLVLPMEALGVGAPVKVVGPLQRGLRTDLPMMAVRRGGPRGGRRTRLQLRKGLRLRLRLRLRLHRL